MALTKIKTGGIADNAITNAKMADDAIDSADFANASIDNVHVATGLDAVKLADGTVTNTEFQYINTLSSNAQTQISASLPKAGGTMTGHLILTNNSVSLQYLDAAGTAARVLYQDNADTLILGNPTTVDDIRFDVDTYGEGAMMILSSGNVGIGITSPATKLHLSGAVGATSIIKMSVSDGTAWEFGERATAGHFTFRELDGNKDVLTMKSTGYVGIGTASPDQIFHIKNTGTHTTMRIENDNADFLIQAGDNGADGLHFYDLDNSAYRMTITNAGNVGIGTSAPTANLTISKGSGAGVMPSTVSLAHSYLHLAPTEYSSGTGYALISFGYTNGTTGTQAPAVIGYVETSQAGYTKGDMIFGVRNTTGSGDVATERMRINQDGFVGIGCAPSVYALKVDGVANSGIFAGGVVSGASFDDRTPYPETLDIAQKVLQSHKKLADYDADDQEKQLDHSKLHEYVKTEHGRNVSAVVSCLVETVNDLMAKVEVLENA